MLLHVNRRPCACLVESVSKTEVACCRGQDFEKAGSLRDKEMELKAQISSITNKAKESEQAEVESGDNQGPTVTEADIANIVAQWTGSPTLKCACIMLQLGDTLCQRRCWSTFGVLKLLQVLAISVVSVPITCKQHQDCKELLVQKAFMLGCPQCVWDNGECVVD